MPSTTSSSVAMAWLSSTVMTPSLPTLSIASAMREPIVSSWLEIDATWATSSWPLTGMESLLISSTTASTAFWMPILSCIGLAPAVTLEALADHGLSEKSRRGRAVTGHVVGLRRHLTQQLRAGVLHRVLELDLAHDRDAVVGHGRGAELLLEDYVATLWSERDAHGLGHDVDALLQGLPCVYVECDLFCHIPFPLALFALRGLLGLAVGSDDREHVLLGHDEVLDFADLEFHRHLGAVVQDPSGPHCLDGALLGLLLGGVRKHDPALGPLFLLRRLDHHTVAQRSQIHVRIPSSAEFDLV